jgi:protein-ribulosamine 3-kinase
MDQNTIRNYLSGVIQQRTGLAVSSFDIKSIGGGSINHTYRISINNSREFFLKTNKADRFPGLFAKEQEGLSFLAKQDCIRIPEVISCSVTDDEQLLLLEWVEPGPRTASFWKKFGEQLSSLHSKTQEQFGFSHDNYMGSLPQENPLTPDWSSFFINHRLLPQIQLASRNNSLTPKHIDLFEALFKKLDTIFNTEPPSLLHGDLWSGNFICNRYAAPVLIDPAVYYGHRSIDLGMTTLFGGFDKDFYDAYHYYFPLPANYEEQWDVCNLYPLLIHLNLFGNSYLESIVSVLMKFT